MYLISLYFDEGTNKKIQLYMEQIAQRTGNMAMINGKVPPHITLPAFEMAEEEKPIAAFRALEKEFEKVPHVQDVLWYDDVADISLPTDDSKRYKKSIYQWRCNDDAGII